MKHFFVINPAAGKKDRSEPLEKLVERTCDARGAAYEIYLTQGVGDATEYVRRQCEKTAEPMRFYACGGDGTLGEVANGLIGQENAELAHIPLGTGNDFVRNFTETERFMDIDAQLDGEARPIDLLRVNDGYCVNMINIGFDCEVVSKTAEIKRKPLVPAKMAYIFGVALTFLHMPGVKARLSVDDGAEEAVELQLLTIANGGFCGGGFHSNPRARLQNGLIDLLKVLRVSRGAFLNLIGAYKKGTHLESRKHRKVLTSLTCHTLHMVFDHPQNVCADGEISRMTELCVSAVPAGVKFSLPHGCDFLCAEAPAAELVCG